MIGYYLPMVPPNEAQAFVATSRLNGMTGWHILQDLKGGSIVYLKGWDKATARAPRQTDEGWGYSPNALQMPKLAALLRPQRPESDPVKLEDGQELYVPLLTRSPRRFFF